MAALLDFGGTAFLGRNPGEAKSENVNPQENNPYSGTPGQEEEAVLGLGEFH